MELDELKQSWKKQTIQTTKNTNIMEMIHHKSIGPVAALKKGFRKQMIIMLLMPGFIFITNSANAEGLLRSILFWSYVGFCILAVVFFYFDYRIALDRKKFLEIFQLYTLHQNGYVQLTLLPQLDFLLYRTAK